MSEPEVQQCDTAEEAKKVPPDLEAPRPETPKQDVVHLQNKKSPPYPLKTTPSPYLPAQNGPPNEPSAAVAAVTVPTSAVPNHHQPTHQTSSTSPAGGVPFPTSLQDHFETAPKTHNSPPQQKSTGSDAAHPYQGCVDYTVSYSYANSKQQQHYQEGGQRAHGKVVTNNNYYNHHPNDSNNKYQKEVGQRSNSNDSNCDGYENYHGGRYESSKAAELSGYQAYEKSCDPICKKPAGSNANSVYNFKANQLLTNENVTKTGGEKVGGKVTGDIYSNVSKAKIPNRTTYYQSIVNKSHSRHKSSRRVLPASAYENTKPVINNYPKSELAQVQPTKTVQYAPHHYPTENKKHDYYQPVNVANTGTTNAYNCSTYKTDPSQTHVNNSTGHSNYPSESQTSGSRNYKTSTDHTLGSSYRDKQPLAGTGTKPYSYHNSSSGRNYVDASSNKVPAETVPGYGNSDYYHKGSVSYSRSGNQSAISDNSYKNTNHSGDHSAAYQSGKNANYHLSRTSSEKAGRNYYANQEGSYKSYRQELVPKQNSDEPHGYRSTHEGIPYLNHGSSSSSLKSKEIPPHGVVEPSKTAPIDPVRNIQTEPNPIHPSNGDTTTHQSTTSRDTKPTFYPYADPAYYNHQRTPPLPSSKQSYEPIAPTKDSEAFRLLGSSTTTAISSYPQPRPTTPPVQDTSSRNGTTTAAKTLWSPTATTTTASVTNREIVAASSRDSHSSHSNSSISSLSQLSQSLGPQGKEAVVVTSKEFQNREGGRSSSNGHSRSSSGNETPLYSSAAAVTTTTSTSTSSSANAYGVSGSLTSLIFSKASWTSPSASSVLTSPSSSHFTSSSHPGSSPVPSVLPLAPSLPSSSHPSFGPAGGPHVMFAPPLPHAPGSSLSSPLATGPSPFGGDSLFAPPPPPPSTDLLNIRRELDTRFLASQDRSIAVPPPPYLRAEMHQHQHQHTHMHQHSPFLPPPLGMPPSAAAHPLYDKFPKVDSSFYGRNALGLPGYPISPLLAPGSATATPTPFAPPGHMAAFQPKISPLVKAKTLKSGRWCAMHVRISWEIYRHQQKHQDPQKGGTKGVGDLLRPPNHLFGGALPRPHELGFSPSPLMGAAGSIHARSPYDVSPQHPGFLGPTPAHLGISPFSRPNYPSIGVPGNSFGGLGGLGLTGAAGLLAGGRGAELGPGGYLGMDPWGRLHRTPPNFPSPSSVGGPPGGSWGGLKAEADRMQQKRSEDHHEREKEKQKQRQEMEKKESEKSKELARESKKEHDKQKERDRESRVTHVSSHPEPLRNGETTTTEPRNSSSGNHRERDWERARDRTRESSRSPLRTHKPPPDGGDVKVKEEKKEEDKAVSPERTKSVGGGGGELPSHQDMAMDYLARFPMAEQAARLASMTQIPPPHPSHFWNHHQSAERYRNLELQEQLMQKYASLASVMPPLERSFREAELARHLASTSEIERQLQADRDRQLYERSGKLPPPPLRPNDYVPPPAGLFPHLPFMSYPPRTKTNSPAAGNNGIPPPLIPCQSPGVTPPSPLKHGGGAEGGREHYPASKASHSSEVVESQSR